ncbi:hypothetical protein ACTJIL_15090 [Luteimonas sp. 22616]|uniref:hypothetical protein n=1 Tax=Luteimonas sp. 22616 TaxID=3453951 RepID=UPI003F85C091
MHLTFGTPAVRELCERGGQALQSFGAECALALQARLADLRAAKNLEEFPFPLVLLDGGQNQRYSILLTSRFSLQFETRDGGSPRSVANIKILQIGDLNA